MSSKLQAHLALFSVAIIYGLNYLIAKDVMPHFIEPRGFILLRAIGAVALFWLTARLMRWEKVARADHARLALCGVFGVAANQIMFFEGLNITTPINAAVMMTTNPILVLLLSALILQERIRWARILGIVFGLSGAVFLITRGGEQVNIFNSDTSLGNLLVFLNAASYGVYLVLVKPLMQKYAPITVIRWVFTYGLLIVLLFGFNQFTSVQWQNLPGHAIAKMTFVVIATTYLAYLLNVFALKTLSSTTVSFYIYLQPVTAALAAIALGKDKITLSLVISAILIFLGVYFVSFFKRK